MAGIFGKLVLKNGPDYPGYILMGARCDFLKLVSFCGFPYHDNFGKHRVGWTLGVRVVLGPALEFGNSVSRLDAITIRIA